MSAEGKPPTWKEIQNLIKHVDEVCRDSAVLRSHAERAMRQRDFWPDRRQPPRRHGCSERTRPAADDPSSEGTDGTL